MAKLRMIKVKMLQGGQCNPTQVAGQEPVKYEKGDVIEVSEHLLEGMLHICELFKGDDQEAEDLKPKYTEVLKAPVIEQPAEEKVEEFVLETALKPALQEKAAELGIDPNQTVVLLRNAIDEALNPKTVETPDAATVEDPIVEKLPEEEAEEAPEGAIDLDSLDAVQLLALIEEHEIDAEITADMDPAALRDAVRTAVEGPEEKSDTEAVKETKPEVNPAPENKTAK